MSDRSRYNLNTEYIRAWAALVNDLPCSVPLFNDQSNCQYVSAWSPAWFSVQLLSRFRSGTTEMISLLYCCCLNMCQYFRLSDRRATGCSDSQPIIHIWLHFSVIAVRVIPTLMLDISLAGLDCNHLPANCWMAISLINHQADWEAQRSYTFLHSSWRSSRRESEFWRLAFTDQVALSNCFFSLSEPVCQCLMPVIWSLIRLGCWTCTRWDMQGYAVLCVCGSQHISAPTWRLYQWKEWDRIENYCIWSSLSNLGFAVVTVGDGPAAKFRV